MKDCELICYLTWSLLVGGPITNVYHPLWWREKTRCLLLGKRTILLPQILSPHKTPSCKYTHRILNISNTKGGWLDVEISSHLSSWNSQHGITNIGGKGAKGIRRNVKDAPGINKGFLKQTTSSSSSHLKNNDFYITLAHLEREEERRVTGKIFGRNISGSAFHNDGKSIYHRTLLTR